MKPLPGAAMLLALLLGAGCAREAEGPLKGVLVVYPDGQEQAADSLTGLYQRTVTTIDPEPVFSFSYCSASEFTGSLRDRRTILFLAADEQGLPGELRGGVPVAGARDVWARGQRVFGTVIGSAGPDAVTDSLEDAYNRHLRDWLFQDFVSTSMTSPERMDSLAALGFRMDVPRSYATSEWIPEDGFVQFQRPVSDNGRLILSIRWVGGLEALDADGAVAWRQDMARRFFYDASADSVDRSRLEVLPLSTGGMTGWRLTGAWINPHHLNAGGFTSYVLQDAGRSFLLDAEIYNPDAEKEPYVREGWILMGTFAVEEQDG